MPYPASTATALRPGAGDPTLDSPNPFCSAVANGVIAVPIMAMLVLVASNTRAMGQFAARGTLRGVAWASTAAMAAAVVLLVWSMLP